MTFFGNKIILGPRLNMSVRIAQKVVDLLGSFTTPTGPAARRAPGSVRRGFRGAVRLELQRRRERRARGAAEVALRLYWV